MPIEKDIELAISAHMSLKQKLSTVIINGMSEDITLNDVKDDQKCAFGQWLHFKVDPEFKHGPMYEEIKAIHNAFHQEAGEIFQLALAKDRLAATQRMINDGKFITLSNQLITLLREWQQWLREHHPKP